MGQFHQKLIQLLLTIRQFPTSTIINPKTVHDAINNKQPILATHKCLRKRIQQLELVLAVQRTRIGNILLRGIGIKSEPFCDLSNALGPERALCVDVGDSAGCTA